MLVLPSEVVPNERRIKVSAQNVETLREQVLGKLKLPIDADLSVFEVQGQSTREVHTLNQLQDKCKLKVLRRSTDDVEDRRARMKSVSIRAIDSSSARPASCVRKSSSCRSGSFSSV